MRPACPSATRASSLDVNMPGIGGIAFKRTLVDAGRDLPTVFITALEPEDVERAARRIRAGRGALQAIQERGPARGASAAQAAYFGATRNRGEAHEKKDHPAGGARRRRGRVRGIHRADHRRRKGGPPQPGSADYTEPLASKALPPVPPKFGGEIKPVAKESKPWWPPAIVPPKGAPNVLLIMTDDVGFGAPSTFGGVIPTPALDRIAQAGLRYTRFHTTALCSPTRAALLTGRNHHSAGFGVISEMSTGFPGYDSIIGRDSATIGRILADNGYATSWFGKNHNTPAFQASQAGPFDQWPIGMGFEYFYGFVGGDTSQWQPNLFRGTTRSTPTSAIRSGT